MECANNACSVGYSRSIHCCTRFSSVLRPRASQDVPVVSVKEWSCLASSTNQDSRELLTFRLQGCGFNAPPTLEHAGAVLSLLTPEFDLRGCSAARRVARSRRAMSASAGLLLKEEKQGLLCATHISMADLLAQGIVSLKQAQVSRLVAGTAAPTAPHTYADGAQYLELPGWPTITVLHFLSR